MEQGSREGSVNPAARWTLIAAMLAVGARKHRAPATPQHTLAEGHKKEAGSCYLPAPAFRNPL